MYTKVIIKKYQLLQNCSAYFEVMFTTIDQVLQIYQLILRLCLHDCLKRMHRTFAQSQSWRKGWRKPWASTLFQIWKSHGKTELIDDGFSDGTGSWWPEDDVFSFWTFCLKVILWQIGFPIDENGRRFYSRRPNRDVHCLHAWLSQIPGSLFCFFFYKIGRTDSSWYFVSTRFF